MHRPEWAEYFLGIAEAIAQRGDCTRRQVGAVIVDPVTHDIIQPGYNGAPAGFPGCRSNDACPRGRHYRIENPVREWAGACACGYHSWPCPDAVEPGSSYDTGSGKCGAVHAEANAIIRAGVRARGTIMYLTCEPCDGCRNLIAGAGISLCVWPGGQWDREEEKKNAWDGINTL